MADIYYLRVKPIPMPKFNFTSCLLLVGISFASCKKDHTAGSVPLQVEADNSTYVIPVIAAQTALSLQPTKQGFQENFDWETASYMPQPVDKPKIPVPWSDEANRLYNPALRYDYKKSDGWEIVYITFNNTTSYSGQPTFMLYNKFRGIIRNYVYITFQSNNNIDLKNYNIYANAVSLHSINSKLLNFANQLIVDVEATSIDATYFDPFVLTDKSWYVTEYELAFDPTLASKSNQSRMQYSNEFISLTGSINNKALNTSTGISFQAMGSNQVQTPISGDFSFRLFSDLDLDKYNSYLSSTAIATLKTQVALTTGTPNLYSATLIPGTSQNTIRIPGITYLQQPSSGILYSDVAYSMPGINNSSVIGFGPIFNETPGIFFLEKKPEIKSAAITGNFSYEYSIVSNSLVYQFNPFIDAYATIESIDQEIVAVEDVADLNLSEATLYHGRILRSNKPLKILGIRVSFNVVPKNGSKKITIIKTFAVNGVN